MASLRSKDHEIFGFPAPLPENVLAAKSDVLKRMVQVKENLHIETGKKVITVNEIIKPVLEELPKAWEKSSIPTISSKGIEKGLTKLWTEARDCQKSDYKKQKFEEEKPKLFDISSCKCEKIDCAKAGCKSEDCEEIHIQCNCEPSKRIPKRELDFLFDQRGPRKMIMLGVDGSVTKSLRNAEKRKADSEAQRDKEKRRIEENLQNQAEANNTFFSEDTVTIEECDDDDDDDETGMKWTREKKKKASDRNLNKLPRTAQSLDRWGISSKAGADVCNSFSMDMGWLTPENKATMTVDKAKLDRWRKKERKVRQMKDVEAISSKPVTSMYFDGKQDPTLSRVQKGEKFYTKTVIEDHYAILEEPGNIYLGHEVPFSGHGISIGIKLFRFLKSKNWHGNIYVVGADGCKVNVGNNAGALVYLEKLIGRPLHWFICQLHGCELPFRAIVRHLDGGTSGPTTLQGPVGSTLNDDLTELDIASFKKIPNPDFPVVAEDDSHDLSKDQAYLYNICQAIMNGHVPEDLANQEPGPMNHSRWLTMANRIASKYVSTTRPSKTLQKLAHAVVEYYAPSWFQIKTHPNCTDGPKNILRMVHFSKKLDKDLQKVVEKTMQRNGYFAHPEAILLTMLADDDKETRKRAVATILAIRQSPEEETEKQDEADGEEEEGIDEDDGEIEDDGEQLILEPSEIKSISSSKIRKFVIPKINFDAKTYTELIDWHSPNLTEPPLTKMLSGDEVRAFEENPFQVPKYPCHTQAVERAIRLVSEASASVIGLEARDGFICQRIQSRKELGTFESKKDYFPKVESAKL